MSQTFYSVSAPAGSGKTYAAILHSIQLAKNHQKVLIAQPSIALISQTEADLLGHNSGVQVTKIISKKGAHSSQSVITRILAHMRETDPARGEVLLISQDALGRLPDVYRQAWHLIVDELPKAFAAHKMSIAKSHGFITSHLELTGDLGPTVPGVKVVEAANMSALRDLAENKSKDKAVALFKDLANDVLNEDKFVCVDEHAYAELTSGSGKRKEITFYAFQRSEFVRNYASVTMMGALFDDTEIAHIWSRLDNVGWKPHPFIGKNLRYQAHQNGFRLTIKYLVEGNWSQSFADKPHNDGTILEAVCATMEAELGEDFLWQSNKKHEDSIFDDGIKLPQIVHGINKPKFQKQHGVALVKAINHNSGSGAFLKAIGFTTEELKVTLQYQNEYQAMMRSSLRDRNATAPVTVCVVSKGSADWLAKHFRNCKVEKLASDLPEPQGVGAPSKAITKSGAERKWDSVEKKRVKNAAAYGNVYVARPWPGAQ
ncbi:DEAD/DEAH box helicase [uncultured Novosphingobium sp.]|uniref:DEAD/DEAH box helicase family protein n=1 Tax=uncultured Novosphingobium sp. TaxID=292277 RepID=UPI002585E92F|nr:DEAD/DEAH box helicase [uncultured Novosphingobium sp.]